MSSFKEDVPSTNCPLCGRTMDIVSELTGFNIEICRIHGIFVVDKPTKDVWVLDEFDINMVPIRRKWYTVENHKALTLPRYREMIKLANYRRLEKMNSRD